MFSSGSACSAVERKERSETEGLAPIPGRRNERPKEGVLHFPPFLPQPPGGTAEPTQFAWELKNRTESWASETKTQKALLPGGMARACRKRDPSGGQWVRGLDVFPLLPGYLSQMLSKL